MVSRRLGFAALPLGCLVVRVISQAFEMLADDSTIDECAPDWNTKGLLGGGGDDWTSQIGGWAILGLVALVGWAW